MNPEVWSGAPSPERQRSGSEQRVASVLNQGMSSVDGSPGWPPLEITPRPHSTVIRWRRPVPDDLPDATGLPAIWANVRQPNRQLNDSVAHGLPNAAVEQASVSANGIRTWSHALTMFVDRSTFVVSQAALHSRNTRCRLSPAMRLGGHREC
jgi:hypothetical protein